MEDGYLAPINFKLLKPLSLYVPLLSFQGAETHIAHVPAIIINHYVEIHSKRPYGYSLFRYE